MVEETSNYVYMNYDVYSWMLPAGLLGTILSIGAILAVIYLYYASCALLDWECKQAVPKDACLGCFKDITLRASNFFFFEFEKAERKEKEGKNKNVYLLYGAEVKYFVLQGLTIVMLMMIFASLIVFWNTYLIDTTINECNSLYDCFVLHTANLTPIDKEPIDCQSYEETNTTTLICFRFVYRYSQGLGEAGGFMFSMQLLANILAYVVIKIIRASMKVYIRCCVSSYDVENLDNIYGRGCRIVNQFFSTALVLLLYSGLLLIPIFWFYDHRQFEETLYTQQRKLELFIYGYSVLALFYVPLIVGIGIRETEFKNVLTKMNRKNEEEEDDGDRCCQNPQT